MENDENVNPEENEGETEENAGEEGQEPGPEPENPENKASDELKIVIILKKEKMMIVAQRPDCDPVYDTFVGDLAAALIKVPEIVEKAKQQWIENPRYPKANLPEPPPRPAPVRTTTPRVESQPKAQPSFF